MCENIKEINLISKGHWSYRAMGHGTVLQARHELGQNDL